MFKYLINLNYQFNKFNTRTDFENIYKVFQQYVYSFILHIDNQSDV